MERRAKRLNRELAVQPPGLLNWQLLWRVIDGVQRTNCFSYAAALAYYSLFSLFPFLLFLTALLAYLPIGDSVNESLGMLAEVMPEEAFAIVQDYLNQLVTQQRGGLLSFGILFALWTASSAVAGLADGLNHAYEVAESRPYWKVRGVAILLTIALSIFMIASIVLLIFGPQIGRYLAQLVGFGAAFELIWNILRWPVILLFVSAAIAAIYHWAPDTHEPWRWITPGSIFAVVSWLLASLGFSYYVNSFGSYDTTYGSIGALIVLLTWMYVSGLVILIGGQINAEIRNAKGQRPTERSNEPTGASRFEPRWRRRG